MAREATNAAQPVNEEQPPRTRKRRARSPSVAKSAFFIIQVLGEDGEPMYFDKKRIKIIGVEHSADRVLEMTESGNFQNAFYLRGLLPAKRVVAPSSPQAVAA